MEMILHSLKIVEPKWFLSGTFFLEKWFHFFKVEPLLVPERGPSCGYGNGSTEENLILISRLAWILTES